MTGELLFTPGPVMMHERVLRAMAGQVISHRSEEFRRLLDEVRELLARVYGGGEPLVLTGSGTLAVESMAWSLVEPGERVLVVSHGEFGERLVDTLRRRGALVETVEAERPGVHVPAEKVIEKLDEAGYAAVAMVYTETSLGLSYRDAERVAKAAKDRGALVLVDAVSALAGERVPALGIVDAVASAAQKAVAGPPGVSFIAVSGNALEKMRRLRVRPPNYLDLWKVYSFHSERRETPYTPAVNLLYGLREALTLIVERGVDAWIEAHRERAEILYSKLPGYGLEPVVEPGYRANTVAAFYTPVPSGTLASELARRGIRVARGMGQLRDRVVRIATMGWLPHGAFEKLFEALSEALAQPSS
ncbi:hypothetical protein CF15_04340 [Pyrodictium occultum]|uniref:Aminotransferase class V domain-containing protein n=1 Tax=Pyrodictium occultum TaxID=2309 RepID=A0A0V8RVD5_PYROC|nr:alanine--glyoxylate aminotransferase family protein [Pyrodictium occultum]KSW12017.1 hypothetical protein CF15_04340 [Pyrodictium occultum]